MGARKVLIGAAGSGKTTAGVTLARNWFGKGASPDGVAYLSFTRAAAYEAASRISEREIGREAAEEEYPLFRTIHSLCYRFMKADRPDIRVMGRADFKAFSAETGLELVAQATRHDEIAELYMNLASAGKTGWDWCMAAYLMSRLMARTPGELDAARLEPSLGARSRLGKFLATHEYVALISRYEAFKLKNGLVDFTDMLEYGLRDMEPLDSCRYAEVDEFQDCCPLMVATCERLFRSAEEYWMLGDDWQSIYSWSGVDINDFYNAARTSSQVFLRQTHRFGKEIVDFSRQIIERSSNRIHKEVLPKAGRVHKIDLTGTFVPVGGNLLILHRHVQGCQEVARRYIEAGIPFRNERGRDPLSVASRTRAFETLEELRLGRPVTHVAAEIVVEEFFPSVNYDPVEGKVRLVVHGAKKKMLDTREKQRPVSLDTLVFEQVLTPAGGRIVKEGDYRFLKHSEDLEYYARVVKNGHALRGPAPIITTIHGSKGREADGVVVFPEMGKKCWTDPDGEHRLAYVAATRTRGNLTICAERCLDWASSGYEYPT